MLQRLLNSTGFSHTRSECVLFSFSSKAARITPYPPPHRSVRAVLPHTALILGEDTQRVLMDGHGKFEVAESTDL